MRIGSSRKVADNLVALGSAAVLTVYSAGYLKTRGAAERLEHAGQRVATAPPTIRALVPDRAEAAPTPAIMEPTDAVPPAASPAIEPARRAGAAATTAPAPAAVPVAAAGGAASPAPAPMISSVDAAPAAPTATVSEAPAGTAAGVIELVPTPAPAGAPAPVAPVAPAPVDPDPRPAAPAPIQPAAKSNAYRDGTYYGWGTSRHGSIQAAVVIDGGKIASASIAQCLTRYSCSWIAHLPGQVVRRQSPEVDFVSGATQSSGAFYDAVVEALSKAR